MARASRERRWARKRALRRYAYAWARAWVWLMYEPGPEASKSRQGAAEMWSDGKVVQWAVFDVEPAHALPRGTYYVNWVGYD